MPMTTTGFAVGGGLPAPKPTLIHRSAAAAAVVFGAGAMLNGRPALRPVGRWVGMRKRINGINYWLFFFRRRFHLANSTI